MAAETTAPSSGSQFSTDQDFADSFAFQLVDAVKPGNSVINISFVTAREIYGDNFDELKASIA
jgi:RNA processing factor Prp31